MSILGSIFAKIFHVAPETAPAAAAAAPEAAAPATAHAEPAGSPVDVEATVDALVAHSPEKLDWRHSIVDLMKALGLDSSHAARIELAHELRYAGDTGDSAAMNIWLHQQVMTKLAENGGKVPDSLKHA